MNNTRQFPRPPIPAFRPTASYNVPEKKIDEGLIDQLFLKIVEGDINKIKEYISNSNTSLAVRNQNNESALHLILKNSNMNPQEKYDLCEFLLSNGVPVAAYDKNNVTALHLASKYQLEKIVKLLLDYGANPSAYDNEAMNPFHYMAQGHLVACKEKKVKPIIPKEGIKKQSIKGIRDLTKNILELLDVEPFNMHVSHMKKTLSHAYDMNIKDMDDIIEKYNTEVVHIYADKSLSVTDKSTKINERILSASTVIETKILEKLKAATQTMDFDTSSIDGWGPSANPKDKILPEFKKDRFITAIYENYDDLCNKKINDITNDIEQKIHTLDNTSNAFYRVMNEILQLDMNVYINIPRGTTPESQITMKQLGSYFLYDEKDLNINPVEININSNQVIDTTTFGPSGLFAPPSIMPKFQRGTKEEIQQWRNKKEKPLPLTDDTGSTPRVGENPAAVGALGPSQALREPFQNTAKNSYYIVTKLLFYIKRISIHVQYTTQNMDVFVNHVKRVPDEIFVYRLYNIVSNIIVSLINVCQNVTNAIAEIKKAKLVRTFQFVLIPQINQLRNTHSDSPYVYLYSIMLDKCEEFISTVKDVEEQLKAIYKKTFEFIIQLDDLVVFINMISSMRYIKNYNENFDDANFRQDKITIQGNLYDRNFDKLVMIPETLEKYMDKFNPTTRKLDEIKQQLYELYIPQINIKNYANYIINHKYGDNAYSIDGNEPLDMTNPQDGNPITKTREYYSVTTILPYLGYALNPTIDDLTKILPATNLPVLKYGTHGVTEKLNDAFASLVGLVGIIHENIVKNKKDGAYVSVGNMLGTHFYIIIYRILQNVLQITNTLLTTGTPAADQKDFYDNLNKLKEEYKLDDNNNNIILSIIAKIVHEILINYIKNNVRRTAIQIITNTFNRGDFSDIMNIVDKSLNEHILQQDSGFKLHLNELFNEILQSYIVKKNLKYKYLDYTTPLVAEEKIEPQYKMYNENYNSTAPITDTVCYDLKPEIVTLLRQKKGDINKKDITHSTPLFYAVALRHYETIDAFIQNGAAVKIIKNKIGLTPLTYGLSMYKKHVEEMCDSTSMTKFVDALNKKLKKTIEDEFNNNYLTDMEMILHQTLIMYNNQFYYLMKEYARNWSYEDYRRLLDLFRNSGIMEINKPANMNIPLLVVLQKYLADGITTPAFKAKQQEVNDNITKLTTRSTDINKAIENLKKERSGLKSNNPVRSQEIFDSINQLVSENTSITSNIEELQSELKSFETSDQIYGNRKMERLNQNINTFTKNKSQTNIIKLYTQIFNDVVNNNNYTTGFQLYNKLWHLYVEDKDTMTNLSNILLVLSKLQSNMIANYKTNGIMIADLEIIEKFHQNITLPFINDYELLPNEYNSSNYALDFIVNLIAHVLTYTLAGSFYQVIAKTTTKYLIELTPSDKRNGEYIEQTVEVIMSSNKLDEYVIKKIPLMAVKHYLNIYSEDDDLDKKTIDDIFNPVLDILRLNTVITITETSSLIVNLKEYIFPYFKKTFQLFTQNMKMMIDNYNRYLRNEYQLIRIMRLLITQSGKEIIR